jgi:hypothetical protein
LRRFVQKSRLAVENVEQSMKLTKDAAATRNVSARNIITNAAKNKKDDALKEFGRGLHALQDYYAHMDWDSSTDWGYWQGTLSGYHSAFYCKGVGGVYTKTDMLDVFDNTAYDLVRQNVTVRKEEIRESARGPVVVRTWTEEVSVFIATNQGKDNSARFDRTHNVTIDAMEAFKEVYDDRKTGMGTLRFQHHTINYAASHIFIN